MLHPNDLADLIEQLGHGRRILLPNPGLCRTLFERIAVSERGAVATRSRRN
jgi:hypothetical protein